MVSRRTVLSSSANNPFFDQEKKTKNITRTQANASVYTHLIEIIYSNLSILSKTNVRMCLCVSEKKTQNNNRIFFFAWSAFHLYCGKNQFPAMTVMLNARFLKYKQNQVFVPN